MAVIDMWDEGGFEGLGLLRKDQTGRSQKETMQMDMGMSLPNDVLPPSGSNEDLAAEVARLQCALARVNNCNQKHNAFIKLLKVELHEMCEEECRTKLMKLVRDTLADAMAASQVRRSPEGGGGGRGGEGLTRTELGRDRL